jgi:Phage terminase large subunit
LLTAQTHVWFKRYTTEESRYMP